MSSNLKKRRQETSRRAGLVLLGVLPQQKLLPSDFLCLLGMRKFVQNRRVCQSAAYVVCDADPVLAFSKACVGANLATVASILDYADFDWVIEAQLVRGLLQACCIDGKSSHTSSRPIPSRICEMFGGIMHDAWRSRADPGNSDASIISTGL